MSLPWWFGLIVAFVAFVAGVVVGAGLPPGPPRNHRRPGEE